MQAFVAKHFQLLKTAVPGAARIAVVINPTTAMHRLALQKLTEVERLLGVKLIVVEASKPDQFDAAFKTAKDQGAEAIDVWNDPLVYVNSKKIISLAEHYRIPAIYWDRVYVEGGGLMSYSPDAVEFWRRAAVYVDKILKGDKPGDLPVEQPSRYYLVLNLKTAKALGITIPPSFLAQADEVIE
jgi:putative ABC transport system substrate-binding protein